MKVIKTSYNVYVKDGIEYCNTPCPFNKMTMGIIPIMAGSCNCKHCKRLISNDKDNKVIVCKDI